MGKKLSPVDTFYIDNHHKELSYAEIASRIGCNPQTVRNYLNRKQGEARTADGRDALKGETPITATEDADPLPVASTPKFPMSKTLVNRKGHGTSSAVSMTKELSEIADEIFKFPSVTPTPDYIFVIDKEKDK